MATYSQVPASLPLPPPQALEAHHVQRTSLDSSNIARALSSIMDQVQDIALTTAASQLLGISVRGNAGSKRGRSAMTDQQGDAEQGVAAGDDDDDEDDDDAFDFSLNAAAPDDVNVADSSAVPSDGHGGLTASFDMLREDPVNRAFKGFDSFEVPVDMPLTFIRGVGDVQLYGSEQGGILQNKVKQIVGGQRRGDRPSRSVRFNNEVDESGAKFDPVQLHWRSGVKTGQAGPKDDEVPLAYVKYFDKHGAASDVATAGHATGPAEGAAEAQTMQHNTLHARQREAERERQAMRDSGHGAYSHQDAQLTQPVMPVLWKSQTAEDCVEWASIEDSPGGVAPGAVPPAAAAWATPFPPLEETYASAAAAEASARRDAAVVATQFSDGVDATAPICALPKDVRDTCSQAAADVTATVQGVKLPAGEWFLGWAASARTRAQSTGAGAGRASSASEPLKKPRMDASSYGARSGSSSVESMGGRVPSGPSSGGSESDTSAGYASSVHSAASGAGRPAPPAAASPPPAAAPAAAVMLPTSAHTPLMPSAASSALGSPPGVHMPSSGHAPGQQAQAPGGDTQQQERRTLFGSGTNTSNHPALRMGAAGDVRSMYS